MNQVTLQPINKQMYQVNAQQSHPRVSLRRAVWVKFLKWIEHTPIKKILSAALTLGSFLMVCMTIYNHQFMLAFISSQIGLKQLLILSVSLLYLHISTIRKLIRSKKRKSTGNQHTYHGIPVDEIVSYLFDTTGFKSDAQRHFGISQPKHKKIASELEQYKILIRGENNARVLNENITRQQLARQLKEDFPLRYHDGDWADKEGSYRMFLKDSEKREHQEKERVEKLNRKEKRLKRKEARIADLFTQRTLETTY